MHTNDDILSEILDGVRLRGVAARCHKLTAPWGYSVRGWQEEPMGSDHGHPSPTCFYVMTTGSCVLEVGQAPAVMLSAGDLVIVLQDDGHQLRDDLETSVLPFVEALSTNGLDVEYGGGGALTQFVWCGFRFEDPVQNRLIAALPPVLHVPAQGIYTVPWLEDLIRIIIHETNRREPGGQCVANHLAHVLFVQAVRAYLGTLPTENRNCIRALFDPEIGPAISLIRTRLDASWTVASLADSIAMSRSAFAARFCFLVGEPPLQYLTSCRMAKACDLLREDHLTVKGVAARVGYDSEASFSKAFKRIYGVAPGIYRKEVKANLLANH